MKTSFFVAAASLSALLGSSIPASASEFPNRPVRLVVPYAAGGATDIVARALAVGMGKQLGQPVVVDNRLGAGGAIAADYVAKSPANGYTVCFCGTGNLILNPQLGKTPYSPLKDLTPVSYIVSMPNVMVARAQFPASTVAEVIKAANAPGANVTYGTPGRAVTQHVAGELFMSMSGAKLTHVPYKGEAPALADLIGGQIDLVFGTLSGTLPLIKNGQIKPIAVMSANRLEALPDVPTLNESGLKGYEAFNWAGLSVPAGTPKEAIAKLNTAANLVVKDPVFQEQMRSMMVEASSGTDEAYGAFITSEYSKWGAVIKKANITAD